jgi:hypothetical protein
VARGGLSESGFAMISLASTIAAAFEQCFSAKLGVFSTYRVVAVPSMASSMLNPAIIREKKAFAKVRV